MPFVFAILAIGLIVVAINGTQSAAFKLLKSEFTGSNSFVVWVAAIAILGALAYVKPIRPVAVGLMVLVLLVMVLNNKGGFFKQFQNQLNNPVAPSQSGVSGGTGLSISALPNVVPSVPGGAPAVPGQGYWSDPGSGFFTPTGT